MIVFFLSFLEIPGSSMELRNNPFFLSNNRKRAKTGFVLLYFYVMQIIDVRLRYVLLRNIFPCDLFTRFSNLCAREMSVFRNKFIFVL